MTDADTPNVDTLLTELAGNNAAARKSARDSLVQAGSTAVPGLLNLLSSEQQHTRWEAAKAFTEIADPAAADALVGALGDEDQDVRWVVAEALIALGRSAVEPVLKGLTETKDSEGFYKAAHHVLHDLAKNAELGPVLKPVLHALDEPEPQIATPVAAHKALESLN